jgi:hypothetical protein
MTPTTAQQATSDKSTVRPFHVNVPETELTDDFGILKWPGSAV